MTNKEYTYNELKSLIDTAFDDLFPICRSITGTGIEKTVDYLRRFMPLQMTKVKSGSQVFDWTVPPEWHFERAILRGPSGEVICDTDTSNLHVVNYSCPIDKKLPLEDLQKHLHSIPQLPNAIPYVTSYYKKTWGFCLSHERRESLKDGIYHASIESRFVDDGGVPYAECVLPGESDREILLTSYICHPSMANNELSGPLVLLGLYLKLKSWKKRRFTYRFLLNPETIGSLCYLSKNFEHLKKNLQAGLILTCMGGPNKKLRLKKSRSGNSIFDKLVHDYSAYSGTVAISDFTPLSGSDERQYCAPGFDLPVSQLSRTPYGSYSGYHNSLDDKDFMTVESLIESIKFLENFLADAEISGTAVNLSPFGEPQLGKRGLYPTMNAHHEQKKSDDSTSDGREKLDMILTLLSLCDGKHSTLDIAHMMDKSINDLRPVIEELEQKQLLAFNQDFPSL